MGSIFKPLEPSTSPVGTLLCKHSHTHTHTKKKKKTESLEELLPSKPKLLDLSPSSKDLNFLPACKLISKRIYHLWKKPNEEYLLCFGSKTMV